MWEELEQFSMEDIFRTRVPMLKSCPHFLRGRLRESFQVALRERHRAKMVQDEQAGRERRISVTELTNSPEDIGASS